MVKLPYRMNPFEFVVLAGLRAAQLQRGCTPRVAECAKLVVTAQQEIAEGKVLRLTQTLLQSAATTSATA